MIELYQTGCPRRGRAFSVYHRGMLKGLSKSSRRHAYYSSGRAWIGTVSSPPNEPITPKLPQDRDIERRQLRTQWKRLQRGQNFLDSVVINVRGGNGGSGCVAFHREKFKPFGPPSGGNGGRGGDVYIMPTADLTNLYSVKKKIRGENGANGQGTWQNGRNGPPTIIKVPLGTVVKELGPDDPRRSKTEWEAEEESLEGLSFAERSQKMRDNRWVHYPRYEEANVERDTFKEAEAAVYKQERELRKQRRARAAQPLYLELDELEDTSVSDDAPLGLAHHEHLGHLVASGGQGGLGNPHFLSTLNRSPKFATRGHDGERVTLLLELKLLADIGLVGMPNVGKSTLLRALTGGRAKSEVADYAFTTLNPVIGVVRVAKDGTFEGGIHDGTVHEDTRIEEEKEKALMDGGGYAHALTRNQARPDFDTVESNEQTQIYRPGHGFDLVESFRFTIADNPGLISRASENIGLGHSFLRSMERSLALVYVVDLSAPEPWNELRILRDELEKHQPGMSRMARMVIANKADLLDAEDADDVRLAKEKLRTLQDFVRSEMVLENTGLLEPQARILDVVPTSAKYSQNLRQVVARMRTYVEEARYLAKMPDEAHAP